MSDNTDTGKESDRYRSNVDPECCHACTRVLSLMQELLTPEYLHAHPSRGLSR